MAVARTNPIPNGLYWLDLFTPTSSAPNTKDGVPIFNGWVASNRGKVLVQRTEQFPEPGLGGPIRTWVLFKVVGPPGAFPFGLGFPTITTDPNEQSFYSELPSIPDFGDWLHGMTSGIEGLALVYILYELSKSKR